MFRQDAREYAFAGLSRGRRLGVARRRAGVTSLIEYNAGFANDNLYGLGYTVFSKRGRRLVPGRPM